MIDDAETFKAAFRRYPTGVALATAATPDGPVGITISSLASVSADPPALSFSVSPGGRSADHLLAADELSIHVLPASRRDLAEAFARTGAPRFTDDQGWEWRDGRPFLPDALATMTGSIVAAVPVGASTLVAVVLLEVALGPLGDPLLHLDRTYRELESVAV